MSNDTAFECPKCKRHGLVRLHSESDIFECIYCHWKEDLSETTEQKLNFSWLPAFLMGIFIFFLLFAA